MRCVIVPGVYALFVVLASALGAFLSWWNLLQGISGASVLVGFFGAHALRGKFAEQEVNGVIGLCFGLIVLAVLEMGGITMFFGLACWAAISVVAGPTISAFMAELKYDRRPPEPVRSWASSLALAGSTMFVLCLPGAAEAEVLQMWGCGIALIIYGIAWLAVRK